MKYNNKYNFGILLILGALIYIYSLSFEFTNSDDKIIILDNFGFISNLSNIPNAFAKDAFIKNDFELYRPLQTVSYMLDASISGKNGWMYHLTNILLHIISVLLLYKLLKKLSYGEKLSFLLSAFFALNPLFIHAVSWIPGRGDLLVSVFSLLSILFLIDYIHSKRIIYLVLNLLAFVFALFSKETAMMLPILFLFYLIFNKQNRKTASFIIYYTILTSIFLAIYLYIRDSVVYNQLNASSFVNSDILRSFLTIPEIISKLFVPVNLSVIPVFRAENTIIGLGIILLLSWLIFKNWKKSSFHFIFGSLWFLAFVLPGMIYNRSELAELNFDYSEHRAYTAMLGIMIILAGILSRFKFFTEKKEEKISESKKANAVIKSKLNSETSLVYFIIIPYFLVLLFVNINHQGSYKNQETFYSQAVRTNKQSALSFYNLGVVLMEKNQHNEAIRNFTQAINIKPDFLDAFNNRGWSRIQTGMYKESMQDFNFILSKGKDNPIALNNLGLALYHLGRYDDALSTISRSIRISSSNPYAYLNRAKVYIALGSMNAVCYDLTKSAEFGSPEAAMLKKKYCNQ